VTGYTVAATAGVLVTVVVDQWLLRTNLLRRKAFWVSYAIVVCFQLVVNGVLTGVPVVRYDPDVILGWRVVNAPVEDILFGFALVTLTLCGWTRLGRRRPEPPRRARPPSPAAGDGSAR
jgi:lycopene cyclase domain-containing protein